MNLMKFHLERKRTGNVYNRDSHSEGESYTSCSLDKEVIQGKSNNSKEMERMTGERMTLG